ncbi:hypothetical protein [Chitinophaga tropicalis]|uniref:Phosphoribosyltransferase n=1 Tax=Chitinophaga tropicalis TaxID=2683588 RepID=A0A7K1U045_9BACT|nr:hypothetical protein [Chitinophaga tropicalis]MVT07739.1 hypothetical protein [Chitinophaga tropicalis]
MMTHIFYKHDYNSSSQVRSLVHRMKHGEEAAISHIADELYHMVGEGTTLVPIPGRDGVAIATLRLAQFIASMVTGVNVMDILKGRQRSSFYLHKKQGLPQNEHFFGFYLTGKLPRHSNLLLLDNVLATGFTASSALQLLPDANVLAYAVDCNKLQLSRYRYKFSGLTTMHPLPVGTPRIQPIFLRPGRHR